MKTAEAREVALIDPCSPDDSAATTVEEEPRATARAITFNFITGGLGSAIFSLPWSVAGSSIVTSVIIVAVVLMLNAWTISIVVRTGHRYNNFDLGSIVSNLPHGLGAPLQVVTNIFVWISMFLCLVSYIIVMHDSAQALVGGSWLDHRFLLVAIASVFVLPLTFLSQKLLERTSLIAIAVNIYLFILVGVLYGRGVHDQSLPEGTCILGSTIRGNFAMVTVMFQAVIVQMCVLPMYKALENRSPQKFDRIIAVGFTVLFFLFCGFSCIGYLLIGPSVKSNILENLPKGPASSIAQVGTIVVVACVYPIMVYPMIAPIEDGEGLLLGRFDRRKSVPVAKVVIVAAAMVVAACVPTLGVVNVVNGAMSAMIFVALLPSILGLTLLDVSRPHKVALCFLLVIGGIVSIMGFIFNDNYVDDLKCTIEA